MHVVYPPKFCTTIVFDFSLDDCNTKETMVMQNLGGKQGALWSMWKWWIETLPVQQKYRELSFPLFSALKNVHPKSDGLHENPILFDCQLPLHSRTCHQQKNGNRETKTLRYVLFLLNIHTPYKYSIYLFVVLNVASAIIWDHQKNLSRLTKQIRLYQCASLITCEKKTQCHKTIVVLTTPNIYQPLILFVS